MNDTPVPEWITALVRETMQSYGNAATDGRPWNINTAMRFAEEAVRHATRGTPDGCKLVPVEPTEEMAEAGRAAYWSVNKFERDGTMADAYRAMLAVAPVPALPEAKPMAWAVRTRTGDRRGQWNVFALPDGDIGEYRSARIGGEPAYDVGFVYLDGEAKPVASPAEGEAEPDFWHNGMNQIVSNAQREAWRGTSDEDMIGRYCEPLYSSPDREAATREAVTDEMVRVAWRALQIEGYVLSERLIRKALEAALAQQAKPQQVKP